MSNKMPKNKKINRKPQATKRLIDKRIDTLVSELLFVAVGHDKQIQPFFKNRVPPENLANAAIDRAIKSRCTRVGYLTKICRNEKGVEYLAEPVEVEIPSCLPGEAAPVFQEHLDSVTHNPKHFICDAYIIAHKSGEISDKLAARIFDTLGAWKHG